MNIIEQIQSWYISQCDGDWEHQQQVKIETLDNPGWAVTIDLIGTELENVIFETIQYGTGKEADSSGDDWLICKVENNIFFGDGGPYKLKEILEIFLKWMKKNS